MPPKAPNPLDMAQRVEHEGTRMHTNTYTIVVTQAPEGGYSVNCLELPACSQGETLEEARAMMTEAIQLILAALRERERKAAEPGSWEEPLLVTG